ncbi:MFS transporter [Rubritalea marina]|uniref:MFS transporter n=1 Tax=Rubritalea marina TaxID=361055 RepID=UPI000376C671|nr:MFS transporter [Rubritalea marina]
MERTQAEEDAHHVASQGDKQSFWLMVMLAAQNAFNDKAAQFFLIPLAGWLAVQAGTGDGGSVKYVLGALIVAPFIFLSPVAGWISDRFSKTYVLRASMILQLFVLVLVTVSLALKNFELGILAFFILSVQSTVLSPAKKGLVKEMVGSERLGFASGILEMASVLAICVGQIVSGFWFDSRLKGSGDGWNAALWPMVILTMLAIPAVLLSLRMKVYRSPGEREFHKGILFEHVGQLRELLGEQKLRWAGLGVAFFWFLGGSINLSAVQLAEQLTGGRAGFGSEMAWFLTAASGGVVLGGYLGSLGCKRNIELGLVPLGGMLTVIGCFMMACSPLDSLAIKLWMMLSGAGAAIFLVPLNAYVQDACAPERRGQILAGLNLLDCLAGALAVAFQFGMSAMGLSMSSQFVITGLLASLVVIFSGKLLPKQFVRFTVLGLFRMFYRQRVLGIENMPSKGGVLVLPNHVSYVDAFAISAASARPVRFLMHESFFQKRSPISVFARLFDTVPISSKRAKEAIEVAAQALEQGDVVCIFPEGQLTRTGGLNPLKRGFELVARQANCPVLPVYIGGLWGSIFSYERGKLVKKVPYAIPYGMSVSWGQPIDGEAISTLAVHHALYEQSSHALEMNEKHVRGVKLLRKPLKVMGGDREAFDAMLLHSRGMSEIEQRSLIANAIQVRENSEIPRGAVLIVDASYGVTPVFAVALQAVHGVQVLMVNEYTSLSRIESWLDQHTVHAAIGDGALYRKLLKAGAQDLVFFDLKGEQDAEAELPRYAVGVVADRVISIAARNHVIEKNGNEQHLGWREGTCGRILLGYRYHVVSENVIELQGPSYAHLPGSSINVDSEMDEDGFIYPHW